jgi:hypothetical protein
MHAAILRALVQLSAVACLAIGAPVCVAWAQSDPALAKITNPVILQSQTEALESSKIAIQEKQLQYELDKQRVAQAKAIDQHTLITLYFQFVLDVVLTVLVVIITLAGVAMSFLQFKADLSAHTQGPVSSFKIGQTGVEISSTVIGLLVLVISLGFFDLYVTQVYQIRDIAPAAAPATNGQH